MKAHDDDDPLSPLDAPRLVRDAFTLQERKPSAWKKNEKSARSDQGSACSVTDLAEPPLRRGRNRPNPTLPSIAEDMDRPLENDRPLPERSHSADSLIIRPSEEKLCPPRASFGIPVPKSGEWCNDGSTDKLQRTKSPSDHSETTEKLLEQEAFEIQEAEARRLQEEFNQEFLAYRIQEELEREALAHRERMNSEHDRDMVSSHTGKAWKFVEKVYQMHRTKKRIAGVGPVAVDDMVFFAENMLIAQEQFRSQGVPWTVDIGYHYTKESNMAKIKTDGLLSKAERDANLIQSNFNGEVYGPGIYTGDDAESFCTYGKVGLIVARLKGIELDPVNARRGYEYGNTSISSGALVVLQKACQCLVLVQFPRDKGYESVLEYAADLQHLLNLFFNQGEVVPVPQLVASSEKGHPHPRAGTSSRAASRNDSRASRRRGFGLSHLFQYEAPDCLDQVPASSLYHTCGPDAADAICSICLYDTTYEQGMVARLNKCGHTFHRACIDSALKVSRQCPICREWLAKPQGRMPSGEMMVSRDKTIDCAGYESAGTIVITYHIPQGIQKSYHDHPGQPHGSLQRTTYIPDTKEGRALVSRLQHAFLRGLTFSIGTSITTGQDNAVIWSSIHHKTSPNGGTHSFPDKNYFARCNSELDILGVPAKRKSGSSPKSDTSPSIPYLSTSSTP